ncbi:hypothetical protein Gorai_017370, partial [Gossypium raimondii]|nr:hypothetical protein [Gossypium raimondii]
EEEDEILQARTNPDSETERVEFCLVGCFLTASVIHFPAMRNTMANLWHPIEGVQILGVRGKAIHGVTTCFFNGVLVRQLGDFLEKYVEYDSINLDRGYNRIYDFKYERLTMFYFFCGQLGHNDSFCQAKMALGFEVAEIRWDLSLRAQSRRALATSSLEIGEYWEVTIFYWRLPRGKPTGRNKNHKLECPWFVCCGFNEIMYANEKIGGLPRDERRMEAFRWVLRECQLMAVRYYGAWFTWERGNLPKTNVRERLHRG